ncbi:MAG: branched-chain amino acid ABC transporter permease [Conexivisphaera sp.]
MKLDLDSTFIRAIAVAVVLAIVAAVSTIMGTYPTLIAITIMVFFVYSLSWSLLANTGMVSLGQALFFALGAYAYGIFAISYGMNPIAALFVGPVMGALAGLVVGFISARLRDWYVGIFTFALTPAGYALAVSSQLQPWTAGAVGLATPRFPLGSSLWLPFATALAFAAYLVIMIIKKRRIGYALSAINNDETAAGTVGINARLYKTMVFGISGYMAALAGAMFVALYTSYIAPDYFGYPDISYSVWPIFYSMIGGMGSPEGVLLGTVLLDPIETAIRSWLSGISVVGGNLALVIFGLLLVVVLLKAPKGIYGYMAKYVESRRWRARARRAAEASTKAEVSTGQ